ncbi:CD209 antigen-like protein D [Betta splendens]|uniref:CD209 antigen-like protein D n=1 Tax=Betta splendens TaxID=158456 RepID=A0A9W2XUV2_BETSP|nr:CD209 antigen-like protein D [Betta splendens]
MDRLYGNVNEGHHSNWIDETIYANDIGHVVESDNILYTLAGHAGLKVNTKRSCRAAALFLGLLCLLLLAGLVALVFLYTRDNSNWEMERVHLQTRLAEEKHQLNKTLALQSQENWIYFRSSFYYISSTRKPWNESRRDCRQKDADLVIINNDEEQEFVRRWKTRMWIGLSDTEKEGTWTWVDGSPLGSQS